MWLLYSIVLTWATFLLRKYAQHQHCTFIFWQHHDIHVWIFAKPFFNQSIYTICSPSCEGKNMNNHYTDLKSLFWVINPLFQLPLSPICVRIWKVLPILFWPFESQLIVYTFKVSWLFTFSNSADCANCLHFYSQMITLIGKYSKSAGCADRLHFQSQLIMLVVSKKQAQCT